MRALLLLACAGCALPVVSAGTFLPAGDLQKGDLHASASLEAGRVLAGPSDVRDQLVTPPEAQQWEVLTWIASDLSLRWQALSRVTLEAQLKLTNPVSPFLPELAGGAIGARVRLWQRGPDDSFALELGVRGVGMAVAEQITRVKSDGAAQTDRWSYRALGAEVPLVATYRVNPVFAVTASPFVRTYLIRVWHVTTLPDGTERQAMLQWSPVLSGGVGVAGALRMGAVEISPGVAVELATRPGPDQPTRLLFEPGLSLGTTF